MLSITDVDDDDDDESWNDPAILYDGTIDDEGCDVGIIDGFEHDNSKEGVTSTP